MTEVTVATNAEIVDFTSERTSVKFKIDDDIFVGLADLPAMLLVEFAAMTETLNENNVDPKVFRSLFELVLEEDSADRFIERMSDKKKPISLSQINDILPWIMEQYGMRPTQPSADSSSGSGGQDGGTSSTADALSTVSTSAVSVASDSSI